LIAKPPKLPCVYGETASFFRRFHVAIPPLSLGEKAVTAFRKTITAPHGGVFVAESGLFGMFGHHRYIP